MILKATFLRFLAEHYREEKSKKFDTAGEHTSGMLASLGRISDPAFSSLCEIADSPPVNILVEKADFINSSSTLNFMKNSILVMGYDVERYMTPEDRMSSLQGVKKIIALHRAYNVPFTFFMLGKLLEHDDYVAELKKELALAGNLADVQQHTYSHPLLKVNARYMREKNRQPISLPEIDMEIKKANQLIKDKLGVKVFGLKTPIGFHKGLQGEKAILDLLKKNGMRFVSSDLVGKGDQPPALLEEEGLLRQHYVYENGLTEIPTHGWHDTHILLKNMSPYKNVKEACDYYRGELVKAHSKGMMYAPNLHPFVYSDRDHDPQASIVETFLSFAKANKMQVMSYAGYLEHTKRIDSPANQLS